VKAAPNEDSSSKYKYQVVKTLPQEWKNENLGLLKRLRVYQEKKEKDSMRMRY
jgi:hypothetical protein